MFALQGILAECMQAVWEIKADYMIIDPAHIDTHPSKSCYIVSQWDSVLTVHLEKNMQAHTHTHNKKDGCFRLCSAPVKTGLTLFVSAL